jgi:hypothetical protein
MTPNIYTHIQNCSCVSTSRAPQTLCFGSSLVQKDAQIELVKREAMLLRQQLIERDQLIRSTKKQLGRLNADVPPVCTDSHAVLIRVFFCLSIYALLRHVNTFRCVDCDQ